MRLKVKVNNRIFNVFIDNVHERPIRVDIDGQIFEVWPETNAAIPFTQHKVSPKDDIEVFKTENPAKFDDKLNTSPPLEVNSLSARDLAPGQKMLSVRAPIPGVITAITTQVGSEVSVGQELCKLEAMKMNNSIRANHNGIISAIHVAIGQYVKHNDILMEFAD
jgi:biotin carboxyl carrier protein